MRKTFLPLTCIVRWALAAVASIGLASTARADTIDIPLTSTTYIDSDYDTQNLGGGTSMKNVVNSPTHGTGTAEASSVTRSLLALPAITVPSQDTGDVITSVTLNLYCYQYSPPSGGTTAFSMVAYPLERGFVQGSCTSSNQNLTPGATWLTYDGTHPWATPGGDFDSSVSVMAGAMPVIGAWTTFDLTNVWNNPSLAPQKREMQNYGVELTVSPEDPNLVSAGSYVTESFRNDNAYPPLTPIVPYLAVTFAVAWSGGFSSNWSNSANWNPNTPPNAVGTAVEFGNATNLAVNVDQPVTVGTLLFANSAHGFTLSGSNSITMSSLSSTAAITVNNGTHEISAPIVLVSDTTVTVANAADTLTLSGDISGTGGLTLEGNGALILSGDNSYDSGTTVGSGTLYAVTSTALPDGSSLTVAAGGTFVFDPSLSGLNGQTLSASTVSAVPEPAVLVLLAAALATVTIYRRLRWRERTEQGNPILPRHERSTH